MNSTQDTDVRDHLAAERTFLAWIRTGIALMGFGFVVARFGLFLQQLRVVWTGDWNRAIRARQRVAAWLSVFAQVRSLHRVCVLRCIRPDRNILSSGRATNECTSVGIWGLGVALINECCAAGYFHLRFNREAMSE